MKAKGSSGTTKSKTKHVLQAGDDVFIQTGPIIFVGTLKSMDAKSRTSVVVWDAPDHLKGKTACLLTSKLSDGKEGAK